MLDSNVPIRENADQANAQDVPKQRLAKLQAIRQLQQVCAGYVCAREGAGGKARTGEGAVMEYGFSTRRRRVPGAINKLFFVKLLDDMKRPDGDEGQDPPDPV